MAEWRTKTTVSIRNGDYKVEAPTAREIADFAQWISTVAQIAHEATDGGAHSLNWPGCPPERMAILFGVKDQWTGWPGPDL
jgi:hypothetical protein